MRSDVPAAIAAALVRCNRPSLVFDLARIEANVRAIAAAARASAVTVLFAAKSFPHPAVRAICARHFAGFDVGSAGELAEVAALGARLISVVDPTGRAGLAEASAARMIVGCETVAQVRAAPPRAEIAIRISASISGRDPAVGAVQDGSGHRRSRFGVDVARTRARETIQALAGAATGRPLGIHVHHGPVTATSAERFAVTATAVLEVAREAGVEPAFLDLGGAWHGIPDLASALAELRAAIPAAIELVIEPGRVIVEGAGFACGAIAVARELDDRPLRVVELSRICHLRWSQVELVGSAPHPGAGRTTLFVGPTCFEEDVLGEWTVEPARVEAGTRIVVRNVSGYAVAWNSGFGGIPPADVVMVE
ncbi:MAG: hypothetical protein H0T89_36985 [Deltaproteobacteria bacterium]|nr:hypothetical protein [Deltaproteobacteria bacterium]